MKRSMRAMAVRTCGAAVLACSAGMGCSASAGPDEQGSMNPGGGSGGASGGSSGAGSGSARGSSGSPQGSSGGAQGSGTSGLGNGGGSGMSQTDGGGPSNTGGGDGGAVPSPVGVTLPPLPSGPLDLNLAMPARQEWDTDVGWCGEESIQTIALHYGAWISQYVVRNVAGAPVVFGNGGERVLTSLHFNYAVWDYASANNPEYQEFMVWMKGYLARGIPTIFSEFVHDHSNPPDPDYDHLVPGFGIKTASADSTTFDPNDVLYFNTNEQTSVSIAFGHLSGDRSCGVDSYLGGCVPIQVDYGAAVIGIIDPDQATVPVEVSVGVDHEPNPTSGEAPVNTKASLVVRKLTPGKQYTLLRYNDYTKVPERGAPASYLTSAFDSKLTFTASATDWRYDDPTPFLSNTAVFYRCVPN